MSPPRVVVIGAGIGGLAAAFLLSARGLRVTLLDRAGIGGKIRTVDAGGAAVDSGPTVFTMRWVFDELLADAGMRLDDVLTLRPLDILARHAWSATERLDLFADERRSSDAIGAFAGAREAAGYRAFCDRARRIYGTLETAFIKSPAPTPLSLARKAGLGGLVNLLGVSPFTSLWRALKDNFSDPRLLQLFGRYSTYCGASPFDAPATLMLIAHVEQRGVWSVEGGMAALPATLARLAESAGARIRTETEVDAIAIRNGRAAGVVLADGERIEADAVICNADIRAVSAGRFGAEAGRAVPSQRDAARSLSAVTWSMRASTRGFPLSRHNVFFATDYAAEFSDIFARNRLPADPTIYVCAQDRDGGGCAPQSAERLFCLVNAPPCPIPGPEIEQCERTTFARLERAGLEIAAPPQAVRRTTPMEFGTMFPETQGALYGRALHGWAESFKRPASRTNLPGLYLAGGSVHPGPGVPMAALSGRMAAESLLADLASTRRFHPAATPGGTSMR
ncbi:MAG: phytoene desaturase [Proteobacteria bacterium]|nr:phytoene desaturase [Pseudomonadota bacterium]